MAFTRNSWNSGAVPVPITLVNVVVGGEFVPRLLVVSSDPPLGEDRAQFGLSDNVGNDLFETFIPGNPGLLVVPFDGHNDQDGADTFFESIVVPDYFQTPNVDYVAFLQYRSA